MNWFTGVLVYVVLWMLAWMCVLPLWVKMPDRIGRGHASSAPEDPQLLWKAILASAISGVLWLLFVWVVVLDPFRLMPAHSPAHQEVP